MECKPMGMGHRIQKDKTMSDLPAVFLEIARNHIAAQKALKTTTIHDHCDVCGCNTDKVLWKETPTMEQYQCVDCHVIFSYKVK